MRNDPTCPFLPANNGGRYGTGRIFGIAEKYSRTITREDAAATLSKAEPSARYLRDRVVGDVVTPEGEFDRDYVLTIAEVARDAGLIPFGYTHAWDRMSPEDVSAVEESGYVMNASCETADDITAAVLNRLPTTVAGDDWVEGEMVAGRRIVTCPAQTRNDVTCASCGLCAKGQRACTVRFLLHGPTRQAAASVAGRAS